MKDKVDLRGIDENDIVHFRCGGSATVESVITKKYAVDCGAGIGIDEICDVKDIKFMEGGCSINFKLDGKCATISGYIRTIFDIVRVEKYVESVLTWYEVDNNGEFIANNGTEYPNGASFKYINGYFVLLDMNGRLKDKGEI